MKQEKRDGILYNAWGRHPDMLASIIIRATMRQALLISEILKAARELKNKCQTPELTIKLTKTK